MLKYQNLRTAQEKSGTRFLFEYNGLISLRRATDPSYFQNQIKGSKRSD